MTSSRTLAYRALLISLLLLLASGCAVLPNWSETESRDMSVQVDYKLSPGEGFVVLPASNSWLKVIVLTTDPANRLWESFEGGERRMHVPPELSQLRVNCRYKIYRQRDADGRWLPWPSARQLFPGAQRIRNTHAVGADLEQ